jgi:hypothetical protein
MFTASVVSFVVSGVCVLAVLQERKDYIRCFGFLMFALLAGLIGAGLLIENSVG